jgi:hypothetical protein
MKLDLVAAKKGLKWYLDLINLDFGKLSDKEVFGFWTDIRERVYGEQGHHFIPNESLIPLEDRRKQGQEIQDVLKRALEKLKSDGISQKLRSKRKMQIVRPELSEPVTLTLKTELKRVGGKASWFFPQIEDALLFDFGTLLQYFPIDLIQKCQRQDCGGYFLKATKKEKRYCSKRCAWIIASRERRKIKPGVESEIKESALPASQGEKDLRKDKDLENE